MIFISKTIIDICRSLMRSKALAARLAAKQDMGVANTQVSLAKTVDNYCFGLLKS
jgi:hypothetical protein